MPEPGALQTREEHHDDGTVRARWQVITGTDGRDTRHGLYESFHDNGMRAEQGQYEHGRSVGIWHAWDETGRKLFESPTEDLQDAPAPEPDPAAWNEPIAPVESPLARRRQRWWAEVAVVLCLGWLAPLISAVTSPQLFMPAETSAAEGDRAEGSTSETPSLSEPYVDDLWFSMDALLTIAVSLQVLIPLLWIASRTDMSWKKMGIARFRFARDIGLGAGLAAAALSVDWALIFWLEPTFVDTMVMPGAFVGYALLGPMMLANSMYEEFVWRGFLLRRFTQLFGSAIPALLVSTVLFASYHIYQGPAGVLLAATSGLIWGTATVVLRSVWPAVVAHTLFNVYVTLPFTWWPE